WGATAPMLVALAGWFGGVTRAAEPGASISFTRQIEPIFRAHCQGCHQPAKPGGELVMTEFGGLLRAGESGQAAVVPGDPDASYLIEQIVASGGEAAMPKGAQPLGEADVALIRQWIAEGAHDDS